MRLIALCLIVTIFISCDKAVKVDLPAYDQELVLEMYLEHGKPLRCLLVESLPYTDTAITKPVKDALVIVSDGTKTDTLKYILNQDPVTGRSYNYFHPRLLSADPDKIYYLSIIGNNKKITGATNFFQRKTAIDSLVTRKSQNQVDSFSVGLIFSDPVNKENYYRFLIGKDINFFRTEPTDFRVSDISFNGKNFSFYSDPDFARKDTVTIRLYSLHKEHYEYLESMGNARRSNLNPFSQPSRIKSNVKGGLGIFTSVVYTEEKLIIQ